MRRIAFFAAAVVAASSFAQAQFTAPPKPADISQDSTHEQVKLIKVADGATQLKLNTFCLDAKGNILAGCSRVGDKNAPGTVRVLDRDGKFLRSWDVAVELQAINVAPDGSVLVAGSGKLLRYDINGKLLHEAVSPHYEKLKEGADVIRKQVVQQIENRAKAYENNIKTYTRQLEELNKRKELTALEKRRKRAFEASLRLFKQTRERLSKQPKPTKADIDRQVASMIRYKTSISSVSTDGKHVYVATKALQGYGFVIWRTDAKFGNPKQIVSGLSGCCGQMDVQCCKRGLYVAENSRHRVVHYDTDGKQILTWGKGDRKGVKGFSSCCNPMNVCFGKNGDVYTAESNTGRIKRFSAKGEFLDYVGDVKLVPGCKNVSIAVTKDANRVYMLDITRNHIIVMDRKVPQKTTARK